MISVDERITFTVDGYLVIDTRGCDWKIIFPMTFSAYERKKTRCDERRNQSVGLSVVMEETSFFHASQLEIKKILREQSLKLKVHFDP